MFSLYFLFTTYAQPYFILFYCRWLDQERSQVTCDSKLSRLSQGYRRVKPIFYWYKKKSTNFCWYYYLCFPSLSYFAYMSLLTLDVYQTVLYDILFCCLRLFALISCLPIPSPGTLNLRPTTSFTYYILMMALCRGLCAGLWSLGFHKTDKPYQIMRSLLCSKSDVVLTMHYCFASPLAMYHEISFLLPLSFDVGYVYERCLSFWFYISFAWFCFIQRLCTQMSQFRSCIELSCHDSSGFDFCYMCSSINTNRTK